MTQIPSGDILEIMYKLRIRETDKLKTVLELYNMEIHQKKAEPDYDRLKTMVKRSVEQNLRMKNFEARNGKYERNVVVKNPRTKQRVQRIFGDCWPWESNGQCSRGDNCSFRHNMNKRGKVAPSNPSPNCFMQQNERKPRITLEELAITHFVKMARSTRPRVVVGFGKSARSHIVRLMNSRRKGLKRIMTKVLWLC